VVTVVVGSVAAAVRRRGWGRRSGRGRSRSLPPAEDRRRRGGGGGHCGDHRGRGGGVHGAVAAARTRGLLVVGGRRATGAARGAAKGQRLGRRRTNLGERQVGEVRPIATLLYARVGQVHGRPIHKGVVVVVIDLRYSAVYFHASWGSTKVLRLKLGAGGF